MSAAVSKRLCLELRLGNYSQWSLGVFLWRRRTWDSLFSCCSVWQCKEGSKLCGNRWRRFPVRDGWGRSTIAEVINVSSPLLTTFNDNRIPLDALRLFSLEHVFFLLRVQTLLKGQWKLPADLIFFIFAESYTYVWIYVTSAKNVCRRRWI